jgi:hypothetical protein
LRLLHGEPSAISTRRDLAFALRVRAVPTWSDPEADRLTICVPSSAANAQRRLDILIP